ncbi:outer membrane protein assembly factor BamE [Sphingomonas arantia]|uniref:Outer membrane protein assembly factor BamE n=1 Tax=Sphingomonas arantia TaxID=1460676 RepID=A0ABW4U1Y0_9SPHN
MKGLFVSGFALLLAGCVSVGTNYKDANVARLAVGMSKADVVALLGKPNQSVTTATGEQRLTWVHSTGSMLGASSRAIALPFDSDGKLTSVPKLVP